jgi:hypothetical protein
MSHILSPCFRIDDSDIGFLSDAPSGCCSQTGFGRPRAACQRRSIAADPGGFPPCPGSWTWHCRSCRRTRPQGWWSCPSGSSRNFSHLLVRIAGFRYRGIFFCWAYICTILRLVLHFHHEFCSGFAHGDGTHSWTILVMLDDVKVQSLILRANLVGRNFKSLKTLGQ